MTKPKEKWRKGFDKVLVRKFLEPRQVWAGSVIDIGYAVSPKKAGLDQPMFVDEVYIKIRDCERTVTLLVRPDTKSSRKKLDILIDSLIKARDILDKRWD